MQTFLHESLFLNTKTASASDTADIDIHHQYWQISSSECYTHSQFTIGLMILDTSTT
jgi:hypothetical protein